MSKKNQTDKYGRGSAALNGDGFVDLEPGDTFDGLEAKLRNRMGLVYGNPNLGIMAVISSGRNANELAKHMEPGESEEPHKFAAKNIGVLFARGKVAFRHRDKKAKPGQRWVTEFLRVFAPFTFAGQTWLATITLKGRTGLGNLYSVEALEINKDAGSERTPRGAMPLDLNSAPLQNLASSLEKRIAYYVGDVKRTNPVLIGPLSDSFFDTAYVSRLLVEDIVDYANARHP